jgi:hypothetical protein
LRRFHADRGRRARPGLCGRHCGTVPALSVSKLTTLDGGLAIDLTGGFTLATNDTFDILSLGGLAAPTLDGAACSSAGADKWACGGGVRLNERIFATSLDLFVAKGSAAFGPVGSSPIPNRRPGRLCCSASSGPAGSACTRSWRNRHLRPKTAFSRLPPVHRTDLEGQLRVDLTRSQLVS